jgi:hypothetical protein
MSEGGRFVLVMGASLRHGGWCRTPVRLDRGEDGPSEIWAQARTRPHPGRPLSEGDPAAGPGQGDPGRGPRRRGPQNVPSRSEVCPAPRSWGLPPGPRSGAPLSGSELTVRLRS